MPTIITNNVPRNTIDAYELSPDEREAFDYLDWQAIEDGQDGATFFRYKGHLFDLGEFFTTYHLLPWDELRAWDGYLSDSFFSGIVVRYTDDNEQVVVGQYFS